MLITLIFKGLLKKIQEIILPTFNYNKIQQALEKLHIKGQLQSFYLIMKPKWKKEKERKTHVPFGASLFP